VEKSPSLPSAHESIAIEAPFSGALPVSCELLKIALMDHGLVPAGNPFSGREVQIIDLRSASEFDQSRIPHSTNLPADLLGTIFGGENPVPFTPETRLVLYAQTSVDAPSLEIFRSAGFEHLFPLDGGFEAWTRRRFPVHGEVIHDPKSASRVPSHPAGGALEARPLRAEDVPTIRVHDLRNRLDREPKLDLVFVGAKTLFDQRRIPSSRWVPLDQVASIFENVSRDRPIVFYCGCCTGGTLGLSGWAVDALRQMGFRNVSHLDGHLAAWETAGLPIVGPELRDPQGSSDNSVSHESRLSPEESNP